MTEEDMIGELTIAQLHAICGVLEHLYIKAEDLQNDEKPVEEKWKDLIHEIGELVEIVRVANAFNTMNMVYRSSPY